MNEYSKSIFSVVRKTTVSYLWFFFLIIYHFWFKWLCFSLVFAFTYFETCPIVNNIDVFTIFHDTLWYKIVAVLCTWVSVDCFKSPTQSITPFTSTLDDNIPPAWELLYHTSTVVVLQCYNGVYVCVLSLDLLCWAILPGSQWDRVIWRAVLQCEPTSQNM